MPILPDYLPSLDGFQWDAGNLEKHWSAHQVSTGEIEQAFFNRPVIVAGDLTRSGIATRHYLLGRSNEGRRLAITFTVRGTLVRSIMARDMSRVERRVYVARQVAEEADA